MVIKQACAIFNLDGTLITTKNGGHYKLNGLSPNFILLGEESIFETLLELHRENYLIIILSRNIPLKVSITIEEYFRKHLDIPLYFIQVNNSINSIVSTIHSLGMQFDYNVSIYCGNNVGSKDPYPPYRESNMDRVIAQQLNFKFIRPIDLFGSYDIKPIAKQEMLLMMGMPGSGKSTQAGFLLKKDARYVACDTDAMPGYDRELTLKCVKENLIKGKSVIVLALNTNVNKRNNFIKIARSLGVYVRIAWFIRDGRPFNKYRGKFKKNLFLPSTHYHKAPVPKSVYEKYVKEFEEPSLEEGDEIIVVY